MRTKIFHSKDDLAATLMSQDNQAIYIADISAKCALQIVDPDTGWNKGNRRLQEVVVDRFLRDINQDEFLPLSDLIIGLDPETMQMQLGDGQHRLTAQSRSGKTLRFVIKYYSEPADYAEAVTKVDCGKPRTKADLVKVLGLNESSFQAYERIVSAMLKFDGRRASSMTNTEWISYSETYSKSLKWALGHPQRTFRSHMLAAMVFAHAKSKQATEQLIAATISGAGLAEGAPPLTLKNALPALNDAKNDEQRIRSMIFFLRVADDFRRGKTSTVTRVKKTPLTEEAIRFYAGAETAKRLMAKTA